MSNDLEALHDRHHGLCPRFGETGNRQSPRDLRAQYERLTAIKAKYDPHNIFHRNVNIKPAQPGWGRVPAAGGGTRSRFVT
jgi:FAD/FMN-containing dehydrogenase